MMISVLLSHVYPFLRFERCFNISELLFQGWHVSPNISCSSSDSVFRAGQDNLLPVVKDKLTSLTLFQRTAILSSLVLWPTDSHLSQLFKVTDRLNVGNKMSHTTTDKLLSVCQQLNHSGCNRRQVHSASGKLAHNFTASINVLSGTVVQDMWRINSLRMQLCSRDSLESPKSTVRCWLVA